MGLIFLHNLIRKKTFSYFVTLNDRNRSKWVPRAVNISTVCNLLISENLPSRRIYFLLWEAVQLCKAHMGKALVNATHFTRLTSCATRPNCMHFEPLLTNDRIQKKNIHDLKTIKLNGCLIEGLYNLLELIVPMTLIYKETFIYPTPQQ